MNLWILRFIPHAGAAPVDGYFRTEERAHEVRKLAEESGEKANTTLTFKDDFGILVWIRPEKYAIVLTNSESSAAFTAALLTANREAQQTYGLPAGGNVPAGSTMQ